MATIFSTQPIIVIFRIWLSPIGRKVLSPTVWWISEASGCRTCRLEESKRKEARIDFWRFLNQHKNSWTFCINPCLISANVWILFASDVLWNSNRRCFWRRLLTGPREVQRGCMVISWSYSWASQSIKEVIMELTILVVGVAAVALWFFLSKDGRHEWDRSYNLA